MGILEQIVQRHHETVQAGESLKRLRESLNRAQNLRVPGKSMAAKQIQDFLEQYGKKKSKRVSCSKIDGRQP